MSVRDDPAAQFADLLDTPKDVLAATALTMMYAFSLVAEQFHVSLKTQDAYLAISTAALDRTINARPK